MHEDLDPCFVFVVAPTKAVVDLQDRFEIGEEIGAGQEFAHHLADHRRATEATAHDDLIADFAVALAQAQADVVKADHGAVVLGAGHGKFELAREIGEFRVVGRPLADQFGSDPGVFDLAGCGAGEMVGGHVADAVARGLDRVHVHVGQGIEHVRHIRELGPVELNILAGGEMAIALVPAIRDFGEFAHLGRA